MSRSASAVAAVIKAYDVRGLVGEQLDDAFVTDVGAAFARLVRDTSNRVVIGHDMRELARAVRGVRRGRAGAGARRGSGSGWRPPISCTSPPGCWTAPARCSPPATTRPPTTASNCAGPAPKPVGRTPGWPSSATNWSPGAWV